MTEVRESVQNEYNEVAVRLHRVRRRELLARVVKGVSAALLAYAAGLTLVLGLESLLHLDTFWRTALFWSIHLGAAAFLIWSLRSIVGLLKGPHWRRESDTAQTIGMVFPEIKDHLLNAMQLVTRDRHAAEGSDEFTETAFRDVKHRLDRLDLRKGTDFGPAVRAGRMAAIAAGTLGLLLALFTDPLLGAWDRVVNHRTTYEQPPSFRLMVLPGSREVIKGESVEISVSAEGTPVLPLKLLTKPGEQIEFESTELQELSDGRFVRRIESLNLTTVYAVTSGDVRSEEYVLTVVDRPAVRILRITVTPPAYTGLASDQLPDNIGDVKGLKGTVLAFDLSGSKELASTTLMFGSGNETKLSVDGQKANGRVHLYRDDTYSVRLTDMEGLTNHEPIEYRLEVIPDEYPRVVIEVPGTNLNVAGNETLNMVFSLSDDFGFSRLRLGHRLTQSKYEPPAERDTFIEIPIPHRAGSDRMVSFSWDIAGLNLVPDDIVTYFAEVFDNDNISGPKSARSESFILRLPSLDEVFADIDEKQSSSLEMMREAVREAREAREELEKLQQEMRRNQQQGNWQEQKQTEELARRYDDIQKKIDEASSAVQEMIREMEKNEVFSEETVSKYLELQQLLNELNSPELAEALRRLQESMRQMSPEEMLKALEQFNLTEEQFRKSIERTMNLLKRIQIELKVDEAIRRAEEMIEKQADAREATKDAENDSRKMQDASRQQQELSSDLERLRDQLEQLQEMMEEFPSEMPLEELSETMEQMDSSGLAPMLQQISELMQSSQTSEAMSGQQQAMENMDQLRQQLKAMRDRMRQSMQQEIVNELRKVYQDLLELSQRQERMKDETGELDRNSPLFREGTAKQMEALTDLSRVTERLAAAGQKTFGVTPEMGRPIGDAMKQMSSAMQSLDQRNAAAAAEQQKAAMASLNEAAQHVQAGMSSMMECSGDGMGMAGLMQRMQSLSSKQQGINQGTMHLGRLGQKQASEIARLAGEQGAVRKSLEQLAREASLSGDMSKLLGDLNRIAQEMREVQTDLAQGSIQPQTIRKQERILSRLLDSQRSMRERDFEQQRRAQSGKSYEREEMPTSLATKEARDRLRLDLLKAMEEGYSRDYQALIKSYFELLETEQ